MTYSLLADLILIAHLGFILIVLFGGLLVFYNWKWAWLHLPIFIWGAVVNLMGWVCPLTPWEVDYRLKAGETGYSGGFVEHYLGELIYPQGLGPHAGLYLGLATVVWNLLVYALVFYKRRNTST